MPPVRALGAFNRVTFDLVIDKERAEGTAGEVIAACFPPNLTSINDKKWHAAVLRLFAAAAGPHKRSHPTRRTQSQ